MRTAIFNNNQQAISLSQLQAGQVAEIKASLQPDGALFAPRIEQEDDNPAIVEVQGPVDSVATAEIYVAGIRLGLDAATAVVNANNESTTIAALQAGQSVKAFGMARQDDVPLITRVEIRRAARLSGSIMQTDGASISVAGQALAITPRTLLVGEGNAILAVNQLTTQAFVEVSYDVSNAAATASLIRLQQNGSIATSTLDASEGLPHQFTLSQNYPNPFNPVTSMQFRILSATHAQVSLVVYNALGQEVRTLLQGTLTPGPYEVQWDARNDAGIMQPSGLYFYQLQVDGAVQTRAITLLK